MKNREIIARVRNTVKEHFKDSVLTNKHIYSILKTASIFLIKREADTKKTIYSQNDIWNTLYVDMMSVPIVDSKVLNIPLNCNVWRSKEKLPTFVETANGFLYKSITSVDNSVDFYLVTPYLYQLKTKLKYNPKKYIWIENGYLWSVYSFPILKVIGLFEEDVNLNNCSRMEDMFKCPLYLLDAVVKLAIQELIQFKQIRYDNNENKDSNT